MCHDKPWLVVHCVKQQNMLLPEILPPPRRIQYIAPLYTPEYTASCIQYTTELSGHFVRVVIGRHGVKPLNSQYLRRLQSSRHSSFSLKHEKSDKQQTHHSCFKTYLDRHLSLCLHFLLVSNVQRVTPYKFVSMFK